MASLMSRVGAAPCDQRCAITSSSPFLAETARKRSSFSCRSSYRTMPPPQQFDYDLYELLGVEKNATLQEIRRSYRWLQKKCHPDIAGLVGHDMSILLNQAYSTLADPLQRAVYDQSLADFSELQGYTGCPLYSKWFGPHDEDRATFVDETRCVGCLKCALIAPNTFAIENRFGRARVVGQWADPKPLIEDAIKACPVDCISWVDRSKLAALEFVMSKEPRFPVRVHAHTNGGVRISDVFKGVEKFLAKLKLREERKASYNRETPAQREARLAAMEGVHTRSGKWWYYFIGNPDAMNQTSSSFKRDAHGAIVPMSFYDAGKNKQSYSDEGSGVKFEGELHRLFEAVRKKRQGEEAASPGGGAYDDDQYWVPAPRSSRAEDDRNQPVMSEGRGSKDDGREVSSKPEQRARGWARDFLMGGPVLVGAVAAWFVLVTGGAGAALTDAEVGAGLVPSEWICSVELRAVSVAAIWYLIGAAIANASIQIAANFHPAETHEKIRSPQE